MRVADKERQLQAMRAFSENIVESIPVGIITYDAELRVQFCNSMARDMLDMPREDTEPPPPAAIEAEPAVP